MKAGIIFLIFFHLTGFCFSQEMIRNGDFESFTKCPENNGVWVAKDWKPQNKLTPDLICNCSDTLPEEKKIIHKTSIQPLSGQCMMGLRMDVYNQIYYEYFYTFLNYKLQKGRKYNFSFYIRQVEESSYSIQSIGFLFTDKKITSSMLYKLDSRPQLNFTVEEDEFLTCKEEWVKFEGVYEANGKERFLYIGNFNETTKKNISTNGASLKNKQNKDWKLFSYYVLDSISLSFPEPIIEDKKDSIPENVIKPVVLINKNFRFGFKSGSAEVPEEDYPTLDSLVGQLATLTEYEITIIGHTDDVGDDDKNMELSKKRAQSVADYLIKKNIEISPEAIIGEGESKPLCATQKEICREMNRRVNLIVQTKKK